jgi:hypothetical protein
MDARDAYTTMIEPTVVARFLLDLDDDAVDTVANVDVFVDLADGSTRPPTGVDATSTTCCHRS